MNIIYIVKKITLSITEDLLRRSQDYADQSGVDLNDLIVNLLKKAVDAPDIDPIQRFLSSTKEINIQTKGVKFIRDELYQ